MADPGLELRGESFTRDITIAPEWATRSMHMASVALATAITGIELVTAGDGYTPMLSALLHTAGGVAPFPRGPWLARPGTVMTASGMELKGRIEFGRRDSPNRSLPVALDQALLTEDHTAFSLISSKVTLERPSPVIATVRTIVGIEVDHAPRYRQPPIRVINGDAGLTAFEGLLSLLRDVSQSESDYSALAERLTDMGATAPTQTFTEHFLFDQNIGTPPGIVSRAQQNFAAIDEAVDRAII